MPRHLSIRGVLLVGLVGIALYTAGIAAYLVWQTSRVGRLGAELRTVAALVSDLNGRAAEMGRYVRQAHRALDDPDGPAGAALDVVRRDLGAGPLRAQPPRLADVPAAMRRPLARADGTLAQLEAALVEAIALVQLGQRAAASARLLAVDSLALSVEGRLAAAQEAGLEDLVARQTGFASQTATAVRTVAVWGVLGILAIPLFLLFLQRRLVRPLEHLDDGFARVAEGDLSVRLDQERDDEVGRVIGHFNEMTRILHDRAAQQGRLAAAGELVAGVAHEVNNPLMAISLTAEARLDEGGLTPDLRADLQQIVRQTRRAATLLRGLLRFARPSDRVIEEIQVNDLVRDALDLVSYQFGVDEIEVRQDLDPDLPTVQADATQIEQIIVNLVGNAVQAVRVHPTPRQIRVGTRRIDSTIELIVEDNGAGVPDEVAPRLFRPFYTTKGPEGTGLGLYISRQVARDAGGDVVLEPTPGEGARFVLRLPARRRTPVPGVAVEPAAGATPLAGIRVLVVDDEVSVRRPLRRFLERRGAQVHEAGDGLEALTALERYQVDVILLDLRMPRMDGIEFYEELRTSHPGLRARVVILSGDLMQLERTDGIAIPPERVLAKPVDLRELEGRLRVVAIA